MDPINSTHVSQSTAAAQQGQVTSTAAEVYDAFFVPALFSRWADRVVELADLREGERVLDVACGTGVLARVAAERVSATGSVVGVDSNEGMLAVARRRAPALDWRHGRAEELPVDDAFFDAVMSQFGLMFFDDRTTALREMLRALRPGGRLVIAMWDTLEHASGYAAMAGLLQELFGEQVAQALRAPFVMGDTTALRALCEEAGMAHPQISTVAGTAHFPSIAAWVRTEIKGWVLADQLDDAQFAGLLAAAEERLTAFCTPEGTVAFANPAHLVFTTKV